MSYFTYFPYRKNYPVIVVNDSNTEQMNIKVNFPDFFRNVGLAYPGSNDSQYYYNQVKILDGERPDQLSYRLYGTTAYHWTFFIINDNLRLGENLQWPLSLKQLERKIKIDYSGQTITSYYNKNITPIKNPIAYTKRESFAGKFELGERIKGLVSQVEGTLVNVRPKYGQLMVKDISYVDLEFFQKGETILGLSSGDRTICDSSVLSYAAVYRYYDPLTGRDIDNRNFILTDGNEQVNGMGSVSYKEYFYQMNEKMSFLRVLRKESVQKFAQAFLRVINRAHDDMPYDRLFKL